MLLGCAKYERMPMEQEVIFRVGNVESGEMTKAVEDLISSAIPSSPVTLHLVSTTNARRLYDVVCGTPTRVIRDTYFVTARYTPKSSQPVWRGTLSTTPPFSVNTQITIGEETEYCVPATYDCWALVWDKAKVLRYAVKGSGGSMATPNCSWVDGDGLSVVFVRCTSAWEASDPFAITSYPVDDANYGPTEYSITNSPSEGCYAVRNGYWYAFNPNEAETANGSFTLSFPEWKAGDNQ